MRTKLTFYEFDGFEDKTGHMTDQIDQSGLSTVELKNLEWLSQKYSRKSPVFQVSQTEIRARQFVGTICIGNKELQILPKLLRSCKEPERNQQILRNLFSMLEYINQIEGIDSGVNELSEHTGSFIEIYIRIFANRLLKLLQRNPPRSYVPRSDNLTCVKGKIVFQENIRRNSVNQANTYCEFDEFTLDNLFNQTFKFIAEKLLRLTSVSETKKTLVRVVGFLAEVQDRVVSYDEVKNLVISDRSRDLKNVFALAKMFLRYLNADLYGGRSSAVAVLIDMNELFENFFFSVLSRNRERLGIAAIHFQRGRRLINGIREIGQTQFQNKSMFDTFQDIVVDFTSGKRLVIDTKYKLLGDGKSHLGISNNDVYQILAYRELHTGITDSSVALIYPENREKIQLEFRINSENDIRFAAMTVNLGFDMKSGMGTMVEEIRDLFIRLGLLQ